MKVLDARKSTTFGFPKGLAPRRRQHFLEDTVPIKGEHITTSLSQYTSYNVFGEYRKILQRFLKQLDNGFRVSDLYDNIVHCLSGQWMSFYFLASYYDGFGTLASLFADPQGTQ